jgi:hypothetical protein
MKVFVYFNLHRKLWSIKALEGPDKGHVIGHSLTVILADVRWKVSEAGRQRVLREKKKNVHAGAVGTLEYAHMKSGSTGWPFDTRFMRFLAVSNSTIHKVSYNPYKGSTFVNADTGEPVVESACAFFDAGNRTVHAFEKEV